MTKMQMGTSTTITNRSYLVRLWQSGTQDSWCASAQCVQNGDLLRFGDVASLLAFLQREIGDMPSATQPPCLTEPSGLE